MRRRRGITTTIMTGSIITTIIMIRHRGAGAMPAVQGREDLVAGDIIEARRDAPIGGLN